MMRVKVSLPAVRQLVFESMGLATADAHPRTVTELPSEEAPIEPSPLSSDEDSSPPTDPPVDDPEYVPTNANELAAAADKLARRVGPDSLSAYYGYLKRLEKASLNGKLAKTKPEPEKVADQLAAAQAGGEGAGNVDKNVEEHVRRAVRSIISEIVPQGGLSFSGWGMDPDAEDDDEEEPRRGRKNTTVVDVEGETLDAIAKEFGFAAPIGAKAFIDRTLEKMRFMWELREDDPESFDRFLFMAAREYIEYLESSGELAAEEVALLNKHPEFVVELDGYREFIHNYVKRGIRAKKKAEGGAGDDE